MQEKKEYSHFLVISSLLINIALSISIILLNKTVYTKYHFPNVTLTCIHFVFTSIGMFTLKFFNVFKFKSLPLRDMLPISLSFCGFVVFTNLSLQYNTVGTYQIVKTLTTPVIMVIQTRYYSRSFSNNVKLTLAPIFAGAFLNSYFDLKFSLLGIFFAGCGVLTTAVYQVWVNEKQRQFQVTSLQLLLYQAPLSALCVACLIPFMDPLHGPRGLFSTTWTTGAITAVGLSGLLAFAINVSIFWIIGNTSPLTYNMVGHFKFCLTLIGGFLLFRDPLQFLQLIGILCTFSGVVTYTHFKMKEQREAKETQLLPKVETIKSLDERLGKKIEIAMSQQQQQQSN